MLVSFIDSFLQLDAYAAAENSQFNLRNRQRSSAGNRAPPRSGASGGGGGGAGGSGGGGPGGGGRKLGMVDDIRGPECKSCG